MRDALVIAGFFLMFSPCFVATHAMLAEEGNAFPELVGSGFEFGCFDFVVVGFHDLGYGTSLRRLSDRLVELLGKLIDPLRL